MRTTIYFVRHGEYKNPKHILPSRLKGFPLSENGKKQMMNVAALLKVNNIDLIYTSPILRTIQSARILGDILQAKVLISKSLIEVKTPLQGMSTNIESEIEKYGDSFAFPLHVNNGGETLEHIYERMCKLVDSILTKHPGKTIVCVSHGDPIMAYHILASGNTVDSTHRFMDYDSYIPKSGVIKMIYEDGRLIEKRKLNY